MADFNDEEHLVHIAALGREWNIGDLYDIVNDTVTIKGARENAQLTEAYDLSVVSFESKWENVERHLQASLLSGLTDNPRGVRSYLTELTEPSQVTRFLACRAVSRKKTLNLPIETTLKEATKDTKAIRNAPTHMVVGIVYGAEIHCALTCKLNKNQSGRSKDKTKRNLEAKGEDKWQDDDDDSSETSENYDDLSSDSDEKDSDSSESEEDDNNHERRRISRELSDIANKMQKAIDENTQLSEFEELFNGQETNRLENVSCRLYYDNPEKASDESVSFFAAYKQLVELRKVCETRPSTDSRDIAIGYLLYPIGGTASCHHADHGELNRALLNRCDKLLNNFDLIVQRAEELESRRKKVAICQFIAAVKECKELVRNDLKDVVQKKRRECMTKKESEEQGYSDSDCEEDDIDSEFAKQLDVVEKHKLFRMSALKRWLRYKERECQMDDLITNIVGRGSFVTKKKRLLKKLADRQSTALVLVIPPLDDITDDILKKMQQFAYHKKIVDKATSCKAGNGRRHSDDSDDDGDSEDDDDSDCDDDDDGSAENEPWCTNKQQCKSVLDRVKQLVEFQKKNKLSHGQVLYLVAVGKMSKPIDCTYSIYQSGRLFKAGVPNLPKPPTGVKFFSNLSKI